VSVLTRGGLFQDTARTSIGQRDRLGQGKGAICAVNFVQHAPGVRELAAADCAIYGGQCVSNLLPPRDAARELVGKLLGIFE
jgi:hypothetical protein